MNTLSANGHKPGNPVKEKIVQPDGENKGSYDEVIYCSVCEKELSRETKVIETADEVSISGTVTSYLSDTEEITIEFIKYGETEAAHTLVVKGNNATYNIDSILSGVYTVRISKKNHATREYENVVITEGEHNFKICPVGDVNGDGKITLVDYTQALRHVKKTSIIIDSYALKCADTDFNGRVNVADYAKILRHVKKTAFLW